MSHFVLRSIGFARLSGRLKPALERNSLLRRWPEGQLYPIQPDGQLCPIQPDGQLYPICNSRNDVAPAEQVFGERNLREATC